MPQQFELTQFYFETIYNKVPLLLYKILFSK